MPRQRPHRTPPARKKTAGAKRSKPRAGSSTNPRARQTSPRQDALWLYGRHAVLAALRNPDRPLRRVLASAAALKWLRENNAPDELIIKITQVDAAEIDACLHAGAVHQGLAAEVDALPRKRLKDACADPKPAETVIVLDQITDPQNVGAIWRSAAAFGARAIIMQDRHAPALAGALAKAAVGAVETLPCVTVVNISRALEALSDLGYHCAGLAGESETPLSALPDQTPIALVLGAEGPGLRQGVAGNCEALYRIPITTSMESLNVSNAAAIALYEAARRS